MKVVLLKGLVPYDMHHLTVITAEVLRCICTECQSTVPATRARVSSLTVIFLTMKCLNTSVCIQLMKIDMTSSKVHCSVQVTPTILLH